MLAATGLLAAGRARAQGSDIPVGVPMALTGPYAFVGVPVRNGIVTALEQANAEGKLWSHIRIIEADNNSDKDQAVTPDHPDAAGRPGRWGADHRAAVAVLKAAGLGADRERVRAAFASVMETPTVLGRGAYTFGPDRAPHYGAAILTVRNGEFVALA